MSFCVDVVISIADAFITRPQVEEAVKQIAPHVNYPLEYLPESLSTPLNGPKGSFYVIAGKFNYWKFSDIEEFAERLSVKLNQNVMLMAVNDAQEIVFKIFKEEE